MQVAWPPRGMGHALPQAPQFASVVSGVHMPPQQPLPGRQSLLARHRLPLAHGGQLPPPQSISLSVPFCTPSLHVGAWQDLPMQTPLQHVAPVVQGAPTGAQATTPAPQVPLVQVPPQH